MKIFKVKNQLWLVLGLILASGSIGMMVSCAAVTPVASIVTSGFGVFKGVQGTTGGSVAVKFEETSLQDRKVLSSLDSLTIYPSGNKGVGLADVLSEAYKIVTPAVVLQTFEYVDFKTLTPQERVQKASEICQLFKTNGLLLYSEQDGVTESNVWTLKRGTYTVKFTVEVFVPNQDQAQVIRRQGEVVFKIGAKYPPQKEIDRMIVLAIAERLIG